MKFLKALNRVDIQKIEWPNRQRSALGKLLSLSLVAVFIILIFLAAIRVENHLQTPQFSSDDANWGLMDYQNTVYYPVLALLEGVNPYDYEEYTSNYPVDASFPLYSPLILLIHIPFGMIPFDISNVVYFFLNTCLMVLCGALILHVCRVPLRLSSVMAMAILMVLSRPGWMILLGGQIVCEVTIGTILALHYSRTRPLVSGLGLALACLKPTFGVPLALMMLFRRDYRAVFVGGVVSLCSIPLVVAVLPGSDYSMAEFFSVIWSQHVAADNVLGVPDPSYHMRIDSLSVVSRMMSWKPGTIAMVGVFVLFIGCFGFFIYKFRDRSKDVGAVHIDSIIICLVVLCSIYHMEYDALVLFLVLMILMTSERLRIGEKSVFFWGAMSSSVLFFLFNPLTTKTVQRTLDMSDRTINIIGMIDGVILILVLLAATVVAFRVSGGEIERSAGAQIEG